MSANYYRVPRQMSLLLKIAIGFFLGILFGFIVGPMMPSYPILSDYIMPIIELSGKIFLRLLTMLIVPLVFSSLVAGVASIGDAKALGRIGVKTLILYLITTVIAVIIGLALVDFFLPVNFMKFPENLDAEIGPSTPITKIILDIFPNNPIEAMLSANMLQIIVFAFFFGIACIITGEPGKKIADMFGHLAKVMYSVTRIVMLFAPYGVFALISETAAKFGLGIIAPFANLIFVVYFGCALHALITYSVMIIFCKKSPVWFFKGIRGAAITAFVTRSSSASLPVTLANVHEHLGISEGISSFVLPLGATINMDGTALYLGVCAVFVARVFNIQLNFNIIMEIILVATLASIGTASVPGAGFLMLATVLTSVGLPVEGVALVAGIDVILSAARTCLNVVGDAAVCVVVASSEGEKLTN